MFPEPRIDLKKRPGKISFPAIVQIPGCTQTYLNDSPTADKIQNIFEPKQNISSRLQFKWKNNNNNKQAVHRLREEDHTGMTWVWDQHCHLLAANSCIKPGNRQRKEMHFFLFSSKKKKLRGIFPPLEKDLSRQTLFETYTTSQLDTVFHSTFPSLGVDA